MLDLCEIRFFSILLQMTTFVLVFHLGKNSNDFGSSYFWKFHAKFHGVDGCVCIPVSRNEMIQNNKTKIDCSKLTIHIVDLLAFGWFAKYFLKQLKPKLKLDRHVAERHI